MDSGRVNDCSATEQWRHLGTDGQPYNSTVDASQTDHCSMQGRGLRSPHSPPGTTQNSRQSSVRWYLRQNLKRNDMVSSLSLKRANKSFILYGVLKDFLYSFSIGGDLLLTRSINQ